MSGMFGGGQKEAREQAAKQAAQARRSTQASNEEAARSRQSAERGSTTASRGGRNLLIGNLAQTLGDTHGG